MQYIEQDGSEVEREGGFSLRGGKRKRSLALAEENLANASISISISCPRGAADDAFSHTVKFMETRGEVFLTRKLIVVAALKDSKLLSFSYLQNVIMKFSKRTDRQT